MRILFWTGVITTVAFALGVYQLARYASDHPESSVTTGVGVAVNIGALSNPLYRLERSWNSSGTVADARDLGDETDTLCIPDEPQVVESLPYEPVPVEPAALPAPPSKPAALAGIVPAGFLDDPFAVMPPCPSDEQSETPRPPKTKVSQAPLPASTGCCAGEPAANAKVLIGGLEEEEAIPEAKAVPPAPHPTLERRTRTILLEQQNNDTGRVPTRVDTLEFRPTDARHGEMERIPF